MIVTMALALALSRYPFGTLAAVTPALTGPTFSFDARMSDGRRVVYPDAARGKPLVLVVGLSESAAKPSATWAAELEHRIGARATVVGVAVLDGVPRFLRGWVLRAIDRQIGPPRAGDAGFVTTFTGADLRARAPIGNEATPIIYIFDAAGTITAAERRPFTEADVNAVTHDVP